MTKNKVLKITIIIVAILIIVFITSLVIVRIRNCSEIKPTAEQNIKILNETFPSDIMLYGEDILIDEQYKDLNYRKLSSITENELATLSNFKYSFIILNDLSATVKLSITEIECLKKFITEKHYTLFYLGTQYLETFEKEGFCENLENAAITVKGFCFSGIFGTLGSDFENVYTKTFFDNNTVSKQWLLSNLTDDMVHLIKRVNGE